MNIFTCPNKDYKVEIIKIIPMFKSIRNVYWRYVGEDKRSYRQTLIEHKITLTKLIKHN